MKDDALVFLGVAHAQLSLASHATCEAMVQVGQSSIAAGESIDLEELIAAQRKVCDAHNDLIEAMSLVQDMRRKERK